MDYRKAIRKFMCVGMEGEDPNAWFYGLYKLIWSFPPEDRAPALGYLHSGLEDSEITPEDESYDWPFPTIPHFTQDEIYHAMAAAEGSFMPYLRRIVHDAAANGVPTEKIERMAWREICTNRLLTSDLCRSMALAFYFGMDAPEPIEPAKPDKPAEALDCFDRIDRELVDRITDIIIENSEDADRAMDGILDFILENSSRDEQRRRLAATVLSFMAIDELSSDKSTEKEGE